MRAGAARTAAAETAQGLGFVLLQFDEKKGAQGARDVPGGGTPRRAAQGPSSGAGKGGGQAGSRRHARRTRGGGALLFEILAAAQGYARRGRATTGA